MKNFEKVLIAITLSLFIISLFHYGFTNLFLLFNLILSASYIFFGFYFFKTKERGNAINIISGIIIGAALLTLSWFLWIPSSLFNRVIVGINVFLSIYFLIDAFFFKKGLKINKLDLFYRSLIIAIITSFFTYSNVRSNFYRSILKKMIAPEESLYSNLRMFDKIKEHKRWLKFKQYDMAISSANEAVEFGKKWQGYNEENYQSFSGVYEYLAEAYIAQGAKLYRNKKYELALKSYLLADSIYTNKEYKPKKIKYKIEDHYWNRFNILKVYNKLSYDEKYDEEFRYLDDNYIKVNGAIYKNFYYILKNGSRNSYKRAYYTDAINLDKLSLDILLKEKVIDVEELKETYISLAKNYFELDSLFQIEENLNNYKKYVKGDDCRYLFYKSNLLKRTDTEKALIEANNTINCFKDKKEKVKNIFNAYLLLADLQLENSKYLDFDESISILERMIKENSQLVNEKYSVYLLLGDFHKMKGNYSLAKKNYEKCLKYDFNNKINNVIELKLAKLNDELGVSYDKKSLTLKYLNEIRAIKDMSPSYTNYYNDLGDINIDYNQELSDSLYQKTIDIHRNYNIGNVPQLGIAYNGLGLIKLNINKYQAADSLFKLSLKHLNGFYGEDKNVNQLILYLNIVELKIENNKIEEAKYFLDKAKITRKKCFNKTQLIYDAYILEYEGDLLLKQKENKSLVIKKYNMSKKIAEKFLDKNHYYFTELRNKLKF